MMLGCVLTLSALKVLGYVAFSWWVVIMAFIIYVLVSIICFLLERW